MVNKGNHPQMAEHFRLVKHCNLPRKMVAWAMTTCGLATKNAGLTWPND